MAQQVVMASYYNIHTYTLSVGTSITAFTQATRFLNVKNPEKIQVQAPSTNTAAVLIGPNTITSDYNNGGVEMVPGSSTVLNWSLDEYLKAISVSGTQKLLITYFSEPNG